MSKEKRKHKQKKKTKPKKARNWFAILAWFKNSAGPIKDKKKEQSKKACRKSQDDD